MVAAVIGMIPEGLYLLASVTLVVSTMRLALKKVLVHDMRCIETLARVNVLCVDKTGTITENDMQVDGVVPMEGYDSAKKPGLNVLLSDFVREMAEDNITMKAMKQFFRTPSKQKAVSVIPFSSVCKYCGAVYTDGAYVLGAPEFVLRKDYDSYKEQIENYSAEGYRVLVFAQYYGVPDGRELTEKAIPLGLVFLSNPIRKDAQETFRYFAKQGVDIKVISGDNPVTVSQVALQAGIENAQNYIDASVLDTEEELQDADCSIAMASGCDAAAKVSQMVLLKSDFTCMPSIVMEGRRVVNNIERSASLFLVKNIFSFLLAVFSVCFMLNYPLEPAQISLISMFTIGVPAFLLALQPNKNIIKGHFLSAVCAICHRDGTCSALWNNAGGKNRRIHDLYCLAFQYDFACGLFLIVMGMIAIGCNLRIWQHLSPCLGLLILLDALLKLQISKEACKFGLKTWNLILAAAIAAGILGILIIVKPFPQMRISHMIGGCGLLTEGFMNHLMVQETVKIMNDVNTPQKYRKE